MLLAAVGLSLWQGPAVVAAETTVNDWILGNFSPLFAWAGIGFLALLACIALSPLGGRVIGETGAIPILSRWRWFAVTLCTTIATGILFWGAAEPLFHLNDPPAMLGLEPGSDAAATFAMSTMFLHWTLTPYAIYTVAGLAFALVYYNRREPFSLSSLFVPLIGQRAHGPVGTSIDILCLYALVAGMAASLGAGVLALAGGIELQRRIVAPFVGIAHHHFHFGKFRQSGLFGGRCHPAVGSNAIAHSQFQIRDEHFHLRLGARRKILA